MTNEFASVVDPIILHVLSLLKRISGGDPAIDCAQEHRQLQNLINQNMQLAQDNSKEGELAKYALVAWADDVLIDAHWEGSDWWYQHALEVHFFKTREAYFRFFTLAREAESLQHKDVLEVFYICVILGFRGLYRTARPGAEAEQYSLPPDLTTWTHQVVQAIRPSQDSASDCGPPEPKKIAPPLDGRYWLAGASVLLAVSAGLAIVMALVWKWE